MRRVTFVLGMALVCTSAAFAGGSPGVVLGVVVHLDGPDSLAQLRIANPNHYARAQKIIAAANKFCRPVPGKIQFARFDEFDARDISCARELLRTSNPPKREISFKLDDTRYSALVSVTDSPPRLVAAQTVELRDGGQPSSGPGKKP